MSKVVIILGCGRSGTSIFGELFKHLSDFQYYSEPPFEDLLSYQYEKRVAIKVPRESAGFPADPGLSFPLKRLFGLLPVEPVIFWLVRHPLDTICSLKVGISRDWGHHPRPADWKDWLQRPLIERCAHHWEYLNRVGYAQVQSIAQRCYFEDMIKDPLDFAEGLCSRLGINPSSEQDNLHSWAKRVQNSNNKNFVEAETSRAYSTKDHSVRIGRWKENMSQLELEQVLPIISQTAQHFGYQL